jgi:hypothetical protein
MKEILPNCPIGNGCIRPGIRQANIIASGHGCSMYGDEARKALHKMAREFWKRGMPESGRYVKEPALFNDEGPTYVPPRLTNYKLLITIAVSALVVAGLVAAVKQNRKKPLLKRKFFK